MKFPSPRSVALVLALLATAGSRVVMTQRPGAELTVSVTVSPICTVTSSAAGATDVRCRNLGRNQPAPIVSDEMPVVAVTEEQIVASGNPDTPDAPQAVMKMVVINF